LRTELRFVEHVHQGVVGNRLAEHEARQRLLHPAHLVGLVVVDDHPVALPVFHAMHVLPRADHSSGRGHVAARKQLEERRLARAVRAHHADDLGPFDGEVRAQTERRLLGEDAARIDFLEILDA
jgi:hypothetical protein